MPNTPSAAKRMKSDAKKRFANLAVTSELKTLCKKLAGSGSASLDEAKKLAGILISKYDKAVSRGIIPRGRADRRKSRIARFVAKLGQTKP